MVNMFRMLEASGLHKFLGCSVQVSEPVLNELLETSKVEHVYVICTVHGSNFCITHKLFAEMFGLPMVGLSSFSALSKDNSVHWWT